MFCKLKDYNLTTFKKQRQFLTKKMIEIHTSTNSLISKSRKEQYIMHNKFVKHLQTYHYNTNKLSSICYIKIVFCIHKNEIVYYRIHLFKEKK